MTDLHEHCAEAQSLRVEAPVVRRSSAVVPRQFQELAHLALEILEARLAAGDEATVIATEVIEAACGGSRVDAGRIGGAILTCLSGRVAHAATAPSG